MAGWANGEVVKKLYGGRPCGHFWVLARFTPCENQLAIPARRHPHVTDIGCQLGGSGGAVSMEEFEILGVFAKIEILRSESSVANPYTTAHA